MFVEGIGKLVPFFEAKYVFSLSKHTSLWRVKSQVTFDLTNPHNKRRIGLQAVWSKTFQLKDR